MIAKRQLPGALRAPVFSVSGPSSSMPVSSRKTRFWIETIAFVCAIACALALLIAGLGPVAGAAAGVSDPSQSSPSSPIRPQTYEGMITDAHCGARHSVAIGETATECTILCVRAGEQFVLVDGDTSYLLDGDLLALKRVAGKRARISGTLNGKTISVTAVVKA
jgi:hypothetical protein